MRIEERAADNAARGGAPGGAAVRWRGLASLEITARARLGMGLAIPSLQGAFGVRLNAPGATRGAVAQRPGASPRSIPSSEGEGKRDRGVPAPERMGGAALACVITGPPQSGQTR